MTSNVLVFTSKLDSFTVQVALEETHTSELRITDYPVEEGVNISDHAQIKPKTFNLTAGNSAMKSGVYDSSVMRKDYAALLAVQLKRQPFSVHTGLTDLNNMLIESFTVVQDKSTANVLKFTAHLKEVIFSNTATTATSGGLSISSGAPDAEGNQDEEMNNKAAPLHETDARPDVAVYTESLNAPLPADVVNRGLQTLVGNPLTLAEMQRMLSTTPNRVSTVRAVGGG